MKLACSFFRAACIFDKDGLLIDTEAIWFETYQSLLKESGFRHDVETHRYTMGASADSCIDLLQKKHPGFSLTRERMFRRFREVRESRGPRPMPGAVKLIETLASIGLPLAMATSARREETKKDLEELGWKKYFRAVVTAEDVRHHKPAPEVYLEAARRIGMDPRACIAFEDSLNGTLSALDAGMQTIFVRDVRYVLTPPAKATHVVDSLEELIETL